MEHGIGFMGFAYGTTNCAMMASKVQCRPHGHGQPIGGEQVRWRPGSYWCRPILTANAATPRETRGGATWPAASVVYAMSGNSRSVE
jgi:hypothetical protein